MKGIDTATEMSPGPEVKLLQVAIMVETITAGVSIPQVLTCGYHRCSRHKERLGWEPLLMRKAARWFSADTSHLWYLTRPHLLYFGQICMWAVIPRPCKNDRYIFVEFWIINRTFIYSLVPKAQHWDLCKHSGAMFKDCGTFNEPLV